jgi:hypothetical protein
VPEAAAELAETLPQASEDIGGDQERLRTSIGQFHLPDVHRGATECRAAGHRVGGRLLADVSRVVDCEDVESTAGRRRFRSPRQGTARPTSSETRYPRRTRVRPRPAHTSSAA